ncbi:MAG: RNA polymerase sigma factor [Planctomycetota bacterium]|jgi:RNA polymerase sigma-70 factor (ECF subfamily)
MSDEDTYIELVKRAQLGDEESLNRLAELARERLYAYVYRLTLTHELTQDILQESMLEMFKFLDKLEKAEGFWSWLRRIAANKVRNHYGRKQNRTTVSLSEIEDKSLQKDSQEGVADLIRQELKQTILGAMQQLKPRHRYILVLRCYEQMKYSEIGEEMGCSEFGARRLFFRAKKSLAKQLARRGLGKGSLMVALVLFGKMTATSEALAANVTVTAATVKVGALASLAAMATSKTAVISLTTGAIIAAGTVAIVPGTNMNDAEQMSKSNSYSSVPSPLEVNKGIEEHWYYYPPGTNGVVMMRVRSTNDDRESYCQWLQNDQANYYRRNNTIYVENYRMWANDLAVRRLPTDTPQLTEFLSQVEGKSDKMKYIPSYNNGLLVVVNQGENNNHSQLTLHYDVSDEEYFRYKWPAGARIVDKRDAMHKRGWTYFKITGQIDGKEIQGRGRIPFVYAVSVEHWPWVELKVGGKIVSQAGFCGLGRPWMGLHTIDMIRRDAAQKRIWFETKYNKRSGKAQVVLKPEDGHIVYTIDMKKDVIESIEFSGDTGGQLQFDYIQEIDGIGSEFPEPSRKANIRERSEGMLWLLRLVEGQLGHEQ